MVNFIRNTYIFKEEAESIEKMCKRKYYKLKYSLNSNENMIQNVIYYKKYSSKLIYGELI